VKPVEDRPPDERDLARAVELAPAYDRPGPRYTSYPPAPHFTAEVGPEAAHEVYAARGPTAPPLSLYVHLPFCEEMCTYCGCNVVIDKSHRFRASYLDTLAREIALASEALGGGPRRVVQLHLGGGTPTWFEPEDLERLHGEIAARFEIVPDAELAIEVDPRVTTPAHAKTLARLGWRRMSMGVQDFDVKVQEAVNRVQSAEMTEALVHAVRAAGFTSVNIDLMYGLPHQTLEGFDRTLDTTIRRLAPDRVSLFGYAHVPWLKSHMKRIDEATLPDARARLALFHRGLKAFVGAGYEFIGLDHFAKADDELVVARRQGTLRRNFMGFHTQKGSDMVAFGITGIGDVGGVYLQNEHKLPDWTRALDEGRLPVERGYRRTADDHLRSAVIQGLMCNGRVGADVLAPEGGEWRQRWGGALVKLVPMVRDGLVRLSKDGIALTPLGRLFVRNVCMVFDAHLKPSGDAGGPGGEAAQPRYSRTV
jgi:oxygen-independent coproporphyrinogen-3 oxidase